MRLMVVLSNMMVPLVLVLIISHGYSKKIDIYEAFTVGAKDGFMTVLDILPTLIGLMVAVGVIRASGALDLLCDITAPLMDKINFPKEALPLTIMRLISSSASTGILLDVFKNYGPDSFIGRFVSVMMSCTETVFYTMSVYFMSIKITKTRYTLWGALFANFAGVWASLWLCRVLWGE